MKLQMQRSKSSGNHEFRINSQTERIFYQRDQNSKKDPNRNFGAEDLN